MKRKRLFLSAYFFLSVFVHPAHSDEPTERVRALLNEVVTVQTDPRLQGDEFKEKRRVAIKNIIGKNFDFDRMAERSLGVHWKNLSPDERLEFKLIFKDLFQDSYSFMVLENLGEEKILYKDEELRQGVAAVKTVMLRRNTTLSVDYELAGLKGRWLIEDVTIDGVSILKNYQESFASVIRRESYGRLMEKMRAKKMEVEKTP